MISGSARSVAGALGAPTMCMITIEPARTPSSTVRTIAVGSGLNASPETTSQPTARSPEAATSRRSAPSWQPPGKRKYRGRIPATAWMVAAAASISACLESAPWTSGRP